MVAVGGNWKNVQQYEIIVTSKVNYTFASVIPALVALYKILWVLDLPYPKESYPVWMFVQRAFFDMKTKFDSQGTSMLELVNSVSSSRHALCKKKPQ